MSTFWQAVGAAAAIEMALRSMTIVFELFAGTTAGTAVAPLASVKLLAGQLTGSLLVIPLVGEPLTAKLTTLSGTGLGFETSTSTSPALPAISLVPLESKVDGVETVGQAASRLWRDRRRAVDEPGGDRDAGGDERQDGEQGKQGAVSVCGACVSSFGCGGARVGGSPGPRAPPACDLAGRVPL